MLLSSYYYYDDFRGNTQKREDEERYDTNEDSITGVVLRSSANDKKSLNCYISLVTIETLPKYHASVKPDSAVPTDENNSHTGVKHYNPQLSQRTDEPLSIGNEDNLTLPKYYWIISTNTPWKISLSKAIQSRESSTDENNQYNKIYANTKYYKLLSLDNSARDHQQTSPPSYNGNDNHTPLLLDPFKYYPDDVLKFMCSEITTDHYRYPYLPLATFDSSDTPSGYSIKDTFINFVQSTIIRLPDTTSTKTVTDFREPLTTHIPSGF